MCYAFLWRLHCDQVLTMTSGPGQQRFNTSLQRGEGGIAAATYLGTAIPGRFCLNFGFHFKPHAMMCGLPKAIPLNTLQPNLSFLLRLVTTKQPVTIKVHGDRWAPIPFLLTRDQLSTQRHHANTPRQSCATLPGESATQPQAAQDTAPPSVPDPIPENLPGTDQRPFDPFDGQNQVRTPHAGHRGLTPPAHLPGLNRLYPAASSAFPTSSYSAVNATYFGQR
jgi:hypothetical protein